MFRQKGLLTRIPNFTRLFIYSKLSPSKNKVMSLSGKIYREIISRWGISEKRKSSQKSSYTEANLIKSYKGGRRGSWIWLELPHSQSKDRNTVCFKICNIHGWKQASSQWKPRDYRQALGPEINFSQWVFLKKPACPQQGWSSCRVHLTRLASASGWGLRASLIPRVLFRVGMARGILPLSGSREDTSLGNTLLSGVKSCSDPCLQTHQGCPLCPPLSLSSAQRPSDLQKTQPLVQSRILFLWAWELLCPLPL